MRIEFKSRREAVAYVGLMLGILLGVLGLAYMALR